jgi:hypothetical protein
MTLKVRALRAVTANKTTWPIPFTKTQSSYYYVQFILTIFFRELTEDKGKVTSCSVAIAHTPNFSMTATEEVLSKWL